MTKEEKIKKLKLSCNFYRDEIEIFYANKLTKEDLLDINYLIKQKQRLTDYVDNLNILLQNIELLESLK